MNSSRETSTPIQGASKRLDNSKLHTPPKDTASTDSGFWTPGKVWVALVLFRCVNALSIRTFFQPDEYFQSLEPAWQIAFGRESGAWITWEWHHQLRSSLHPVLFAGIYLVADKLLKVLQFSPHSQGAALAVIPSLAQAGIAATGEFYTWQLARKVYEKDSDIAWSTLAITVLSPWQWFCSTRTFSNCLETTLTITALYFWPQSLLVLPNFALGQPKKRAPRVISELFTSSGSVKHLRTSLVLAATACILRPTNALIWFCIVMPLVANLFSSKTRLGASEYLIILREGLLCGLTALTLSAISDRLYFQEYTFPPYQWLNFNISQDLAVFYGRNDWHYYLSQGLPLLLTTFLPFALFGLWKSTSIQANEISLLLSSTVLVTIGVLSTISHKEVRFIYPLLPLLHILTAPVFSYFFFESRQNSTSNTQIQSTSKSSTALFSINKKPLLGLLLLINFIVASYTSLVHQRAVLDVLTFLRNDFESIALTSSSKSPSIPFSSEETFVGFLMPCHSTPWRSKLIHPGLKAWALGCEPPIHLAARSEEREAYRDEADRFYDDSLAFLRTEVSTKDRPWPRYIAGFAGIEEVLKEHVKREMKGVKVKEKWRGKNSDWHDDSRRAGDVIVWEFVDQGLL